MIVDFVGDVLFGVMTWLVGLLPQWGYINVTTNEVQEVGPLLQGMATARRWWAAADYFLPLTEITRLLVYYMVGYGFVAFYRFVLRVKPWG